MELNGQINQAVEAEHILINLLCVSFVTHSPHVLQVRAMAWCLPKTRATLKMRAPSRFRPLSPALDQREERTGDSALQPLLLLLAGTLTPRKKRLMVTDDSCLLMSCRTFLKSSKLSGNPVTKPRIFSQFLLYIWLLSPWRYSVCMKSEVSHSLCNLSLRQSSLTVELWSDVAVLPMCFVCCCVSEEDLQHFSNPHGLAAHSPGSPSSGHRWGEGWVGRRASCFVAQEAKT